MTVQQQIVAQAQAAGVDPNLALAIAQNESGFNQSAISSTGAIGVMQLMPTTAQELGVNPNDLTQNIAGGIQYLSQLLTQFGGDIGLTAAAYNAGPNGDFSQPGVTNYANNVVSTYQSLTNSNAAYVGGIPDASTGVTAISIDPSQQDMGVLVGLGIAAVALIAFAGGGHG
jgi:soluble lytic murein transglycosylase-like protein